MHLNITPRVICPDMANWGYVDHNHLHLKFEAVVIFGNLETAAEKKRKKSETAKDGYSFCDVTHLQNQVSRAGVEYM